MLCLEGMHAKEFYVLQMHVMGKCDHWYDLFRVCIALERGYNPARTQGEKVCQEYSSST